MRACGWVVVWAALAAGLGGGMTGCTGPTDQDRRELQAGFARFEAKDYGAGQKAATLYIGKFPNDPQVGEAYYLRGISRIGAGDKTGGAEDLRAAAARTERADLKLKANRTLGDLDYDAGQYGPAGEHYRAALKCSPDDRVGAYLLLRVGASLQALGRWSEARPYLQEALQKRPDTATAQSILARLAASRFELQYGAFRDEAAARSLALRVKGVGLAAYVATDVRDRVPWYAVRSMGGATHAEAAAARAAAVRKWPGVVIVPP